MMTLCSNESIIECADVREYSFAESWSVLILQLKNPNFANAMAKNSFQGVYGTSLRLSRSMIYKQGKTNNINCFIIIWHIWHKTVHITSMISMFGHSACGTNANADIQSKIYHLYTLHQACQRIKRSNDLWRNNFITFFCLYASIARRDAYTQVYHTHK